MGIFKSAQVAGGHVIQVAQVYPFLKRMHFESSVVLLELRYEINKYFGKN